MAHRDSLLALHGTQLTRLDEQIERGACLVVRQRYIVSTLRSLGQDTQVAEHTLELLANALAQMRAHREHLAKRLEALEPPPRETAPRQ